MRYAAMLHGKGKFGEANKLLKDVYELHVDEIPNTLDTMLFGCYLSSRFFDQENYAEAVAWARKALDSSKKVAPIPGIDMSDMAIVLQSTLVDALVGARAHNSKPPVRSLTPSARATQSELGLTNPTAASEANALREKVVVCRRLSSHHRLTSVDRWPRPKARCQSRRRVCFTPRRRRSTFCRPPVECLVSARRRCELTRPLQPVV